MKSILQTGGPFALMAMMVAGTCIPASGQDIPDAIVHVKVFDCFGTRIHKAEVHLESEDGTKKITSDARTHIFKNVPYGIYILTAWDAGGGVARRTVVVNAREVWVHAGLSFPSGDRLWPGGDLSLAGDIHPAPQDDSWWLKVQGTYLSAEREGPVQKSGAFNIDGLEMGSYTVQVFEGSHLRKTESIELSIKSPQTKMSIQLLQDDPLK